MASDNIRSINSFFLKKLEEHGLSVIEIANARERLTEERFTPAIVKLESLCKAFDQFSALFTQYKHLIQLHRPVTILYAALGDNASFLKFVSDVERGLTQNFLSLSIKPVQRLPRYILLLKEMLKCVHRSVPLFEGDDKEALISARFTLRETCIMISNCTLLCNNAMREYEDLQTLHKLDRQFQDCELKKKYNFVTIRKNRVHVLEGTIRRRHDRIGMKTYQCHVFSDIMLVSVIAGRGGLRLKNIIPLHADCGVACIPIPNSALGSVESTAEGIWFAMVTNNKIMFFSVKSCVERDRWVKAINSVLHKNNGDHDILYNSERVDLYNKHVRKYYKRHGGTDAGIAAAESAVCVTQVNWWQILSLSAEKGIHTTLSEGNTKAINRLLQTFDKKKIGPLEHVFSEHSTHFPICFDYFFDFPKKILKASSSFNHEFQPPSVIKLYLFHDVVVAATLSGNEDGRSAYYFHIDVAALQLRSDDSSLSITLVDTTVVPTKGIMQNLWKSDVRERTLTASCMAGKKKWARLLEEAIATLKASSPMFINPEFCTKVRCTGTAAWRYEDRPSINWDNI